MKPEEEESSKKNTAEKHKLLNNKTDLQTKKTFGQIEGLQNEDSLIEAVSHLLGGDKTRPKNSQKSS